MELSPDGVRGYLDYLRDLGIYDLYRRGEPGTGKALLALLSVSTTQSHSATQNTSTNQGSRSLAEAAPSAKTPVAVPPREAKLPASSRRPPGAATLQSSIGHITAPVPARVPEIAVALVQPLPSRIPPYSPEALAMPIQSFNQLAPLPAVRTSSADKADALQAVRAEIGDCTRCPLAYAGRHSIVFADGDPNAQLMFVGEGPGADEDETGIPFVGKAGQLLNNMITAMGLKREAVYIANIVKCRPPKNRVPEPLECNTCSQFLLRQIDVVQPRVIVALGSTAATYLLGLRKPVGALRGEWHDVRGARCAVTYHPAFLLRDPAKKGEAWKDLQRVMVELDLMPPQKSVSTAP